MDWLGDVFCQLNEFFSSFKRVASTSLRLGRGLCHGDPLSPFLFLFCTEGLSHILYKAQEIGDIRGVQVYTSSLRITHLFFMDKTILFLHDELNSV